MLDYGLPPSKPGDAVDLRALNRVIDYPARDMTITVEAGLTVAELRSVLAPESQRLPIDVPASDQATIGGIIATNVSGPRRYGLGTLRDYVLGMSAINDQGQEIKAGGRVVKNVAGYDLCKLFVGSLGTLGILTQVTFKVTPRPQANALLTLSCDGRELSDIVEQLRLTKTRPICLEVLNRRAAAAIRKGADSDSSEEWAVVVGFEGNAEAVKWQVQQAVMELGSRSNLEVHLGSPSEPVLRILEELPAKTPGGLTWKANLLPSGVADFCVEVDKLDAMILLQAHAGNGIVVGEMPDLTQDQAADILNELRRLALVHNGKVIVQRCPSSWKSDLSVWGSPPGSINLMRRVKQSLDPNNRFNPGRFINGI